MDRSLLMENRKGKRMVLQEKACFCLIAINSMDCFKDKKYFDKMLLLVWEYPIFVVPLIADRQGESVACCC